MIPQRAYNTELRRLVADLALDRHILGEIVWKRGLRQGASVSSSSGWVCGSAAAGARQREGFQQVLPRVAMGTVGIVRGSRHVPACR